MRRLSFLLCLALLVSQLGFSVESMAAVWGKGGAISVVSVSASEETVSSRIDCDAFGAATCGAFLHCETCSLCHTCHWPALMSGERDHLAAIPAQQLSSTSAVGHVSADHPPDIKPPIL